MLPPLNRLKEERDFRRVLKFGQGFYSRNFRLKLAKNEQKATRFGFVIGLKLSKKATIRNRLKRQAREVIRLMLKNGLIKPNFDVVINFGPGLIGQKYEEIKREVAYLLKKAGLSPSFGKAQDRLL